MSGVFVVVLFLCMHSSDTGIHKEGVDTQTETSKRVRQMPLADKSLPDNVYSKRTNWLACPLRCTGSPYTPKHRCTRMSSFAYQAWFCLPVIPATPEAETRISCSKPFCVPGSPQASLGPLSEILSPKSKMKFGVVAGQRVSA